MITEVIDADDRINGESLIGRRTETLHCRFVCSLLIHKQHKGEHLSLKEHIYRIHRASAYYASIRAITDNRRYISCEAM